MPHVITQSCCNDGSCVFACPVNCIHPTPDEPGFATSEMLYIDPVACVDCGACVSACPVGAIAPETRLELKQLPFVEINASFYPERPADVKLPPTSKLAPVTSGAPPGARSASPRAGWHSTGPSPRSPRQRAGDRAALLRGPHRACHRRRPRAAPGSAKSQTHLAAPARDLAPSRRDAGGLPMSTRGSPPAPRAGRRPDHAPTSPSRPGAGPAGYPAPTDDGRGRGRGGRGRGDRGRRQRRRRLAAARCRRGGARCRHRAQVPAPTPGRTWRGPGPPPPTAATAAGGSEPRARSSTRSGRCGAPPRRSRTPSTCPAPAPDLADRPISSALATSPTTPCAHWPLLLAADGTLRSVDTSRAAPWHGASGRHPAVADGGVPRVPAAGGALVLTLATGAWRAVDTGDRESHDRVVAGHRAVRACPGPARAGGGRCTPRSGLGPSTSWHRRRRSTGGGTWAPAALRRTWAGRGGPRRDHPLAGAAGPGGRPAHDALLVLSAGAMLQRQPRPNFCCGVAFWLEPDVVYGSRAQPGRLVAWRVGTHEVRR